MIKDYRIIINKIEQRINNDWILKNCTEINTIFYLFLGEYYYSKNVEIMGKLKNGKICVKWGKNGKTKKNI